MSNKKRNILTPKIDVDDSLEYDYLSAPEIDFTTFKKTEHVYIVRQIDIHRIDLISYRVYGNPNYWWVIARRNNIIDTHNDLYTGMKLYVPNLSELFSYINNKRKPEDVDTKKYAVREL